MCSYGESVIAHASCSRQSSATAEISSRVKTRPVGLCGVLRTIAFVRFENAALSRSRLRPQCGGSSGTNTGFAPARIASGP